MKENNFERWLLDQLWLAYTEARKRKRRTMDEHRFELNAYENLMNLRDDIIERTYKPSRGVTFIIHDPVTREIFAAPFRDRVVHHFLYAETYDWWDRRLIQDSYSCRVGKGTLYGQQRLAQHIRKATKNYQEDAFIAKLDLRGYFMSLKRTRLVERINWGLDRQFENNKGQLYWTLKYLWREVIMDDPVRGVTIRGKWSDWNSLPPEKSLFYQPKGQGIVIGNLTSQCLSNIYLDQLDRFVTLTLGYKHYGRYVDDFYIIVPMSQKPQLLRDIPVIEEYLKGLGLTLHPKKRQMQNTKKGTGFLGTVVYEGYMVPGRRVKKRCNAACKRFAEGRGQIETVQSYMGHLEHINSTKYLADLFESLGWELEL